MVLIIANIKSIGPHVFPKSVNTVTFVTGFYDSLSYW